MEGDVSDNAALEAWLSSLEPRAELVARMALRSRIAERRNDKNFFHRIAGLTRELRLRPEELGAACSEAHTIAVQLEAFGSVRRDCNTHERVRSVFQGIYGKQSGA